MRSVSSQQATGSATSASPYSRARARARRRAAGGPGGARSSPMAYFRLYPVVWQNSSRIRPFSRLLARP